VIDVQSEMMMKTLLAAFALSLMCIAGGSAQAQRSPAAQSGDPDIQQLSRAWAALGENRLDEAATLAEQVAGRSALFAHEASGLLMESRPLAIAAGARRTNGGRDRQDAMIAFAVTDAMVALDAQPPKAILRCAPR
jgi:hypothetical protein